MTIRRALAERLRSPPVAGEDDSRDFVDALMASWARSRPELDVAPMAVATRLSRVRDHLEGEMAAVFGAFGLTAPSFVMLVTLTRLGGADGRVPEAQLPQELGLTAGTIAVRIDRLAGDGLVARDGDDGVGLTARGRELVEQVVPAHLETQARLLAALTAGEQDALASLLRKLLVALEGHQED